MGSWTGGNNASSRSIHFLNFIWAVMRDALTMSVCLDQPTLACSVFTSHSLRQLFVCPQAPFRVWIQDGVQFLKRRSLAKIRLHCMQAMQDTKTYKPAAHILSCEVWFRISWYHGLADNITKTHWEIKASCWLTPVLSNIKIISPKTMWTNPPFKNTD